MSTHGHRRPDVERTAKRLEAECPAPSHGFQAGLRRQLTEARASARRRDRVLVAAYAGFGTALLAIAAIGLAGAGPFAA